MNSKICNTCKKEKPLSDFHKNISRKDGFSHRCKICRNLHYKNDYSKNRDFYLERNNKRRRDWKVWLRSFKLECMICGETHPSCLNFHHKERKEFMISRFINRKSFSEKNRQIVIEEMEKCQLLCSNCHAKEHWTDQL